MKPTTTDDVLDLLDASFASAALGAALELGLFWLLETQPLDEQEIARELRIPPHRCHYWLQLLSREGLLTEGPDGYELGAASRTAIIGAYSRETWALLAEEARQRLPGLRDLALHIREPGSAYEALGFARPSYVARMADDLAGARRFTRMLHELHQPLARELAGFLDLDGVRTLMDLGGGSGVISHELLRRNPGLAVTVVDIANVCTSGREIAAEMRLADRINYHPANFVTDELPRGFDVVLECDVNVYGEELFRKVRRSLAPGGRFVIVDLLAPGETVAPPSRLHWAFEGSLIDPEFTFPTAARVRELLERTGFALVSERSLPPAAGASRDFAGSHVVIEARR